MDIASITKQFEGGTNCFHTKIEVDTFTEALRTFSQGRYISSVAVAFVLYEKIFAIKLIRETSWPNGFVPTKNNVEEQFLNLGIREQQVIDGEKKRGLNFQEITKQLFQINTITLDEKNDFDWFYTEYRNPALHGLTYRLFEILYGRPPTSTIEMDMCSDDLHRRLAEIVINKIFGIVSDGRFLKK